MATPTKILRFPPIDLSNMPVIDLTQRPGTSTTTTNARPSSSRRGGGDNATGRAGANDGDGVCNGSKGNNNGDRNRTLNKFNRLVPRPDNEPPTTCQLYGNSASCFTELCGWSLLMPLKLFNIRSATHLHLMTDGRGEVIKEAEDLKARAITLREAEGFASLKILVNTPVSVQVVAKRKVDVVAYNKQILLIPLIIIADSSGYCALCSINEGLSTIYNEVEVGDLLLITKFLPQIPRRTYHRNLFENEMFLNLELKLQFHTVRNHYVRKFSSIHSSSFKIPLDLFPSNSHLNLPSDLESELHPTPANAPSTPHYYDLIGVVTYVGRIERFHSDAPEVRCLHNGVITSENIKRFVPYRWIYLIDRTSSPLPVKLYINNLTFPLQPSIIPGGILILSHCETTNFPHTIPHTSTSSFTQLYLEGQIEKYLMLHPPTWKQKSVEILAAKNYSEIISRPNIQLALGGTHAMKITSPQNFIDLFKNNLQYQTIPNDLPMARRESRRLHFEGMILRVSKVDNEHMPTVNYVHPNYSTQNKRKREGMEYTVIENFYPYPMNAHTSWYAFQRRLPQFDEAHLNQSRCRDIIKKIVATYKPFIGPLLMPAEMEAYQESGPAPPLAKLDKLDGPPYLLMDIVNEETLTWYTVIWKSRQFTREEMVDKVEGAKDKKILCWAEVFCTEPEAPLEVNLLDFVIVD